jgi:hypothetical protein
MAHVQRCDAGGKQHDLERGQRFLQVYIMDSASMPHTVRMYCVEHARMVARGYVDGVFNGDWTSLKAEWREAL